MGVQPIRGVVVRLRLRVSGARANHLCGRARQSRADKRARPAALFGTRLAVVNTRMLTYYPPQEP